MANSRKSYGTWALTEDAQGNGKIVSCASSDCVNSKHYDHFVGKYEDAIKWFFGDTTQSVSEAASHNKHWGNLINLVIYQNQTGNTIMKTVAELYDKLNEAVSSMKYWVPPNDREFAIRETLIEAENKFLLHDRELLDYWNKKEEDGTIRMLEKRRKRKLLDFCQRYEWNIDGENVNIY